MSEVEQQYLLELWEKNICPYCGKSIPDGKKTGSGQRNDGGFCSLDCYTRYHERELVDRARLVQEIARRHRES